jgi:hypothetical protein
MALEDAEAPRGDEPPNTPMGDAPDPPETSLD